jgi:hypothetical protein
MMISFDTTFHGSGSSPSCVPNFVVLLLGLELIGTICLVIFFHPITSSSNIFYVSCLIYLMFWTIYFAWHSMVKENSFELSAFMSMAIVMSAEGFYFLIEFVSNPTAKYCGIAFYYVALMAYLLSSYHCYMRNATQALNDLSHSEHLQLLALTKDCEIFVSIVKLNIVFYSIVLSTLLFYVWTEWKSFAVYGSVLFAVLLVCFFTHSLMGIRAAIKEKKKSFIVFLALNPVVEIAMCWILAELYASPEGEINRTVRNQATLIVSLATIANVAAVFLGVKVMKNFGRGVTSILRQTNDDNFKAPFI